jgi:hypothetical protein
MYAKKGLRVSDETVQKSRFSEPVYYVFDNRGTERKGKVGSGTKEFTA